jgi:hypothetical protein
MRPTKLVSLVSRAVHSRVIQIENLGCQLLDAMECCHPMQRYAATWVRSVDF